VRLHRGEHHAASAPLLAFAKHYPPQPGHTEHH
jgi:hypothetical protein